MSTVEEDDEHKPGITVSVRVKPLDNKQDVCIVRPNPSSISNSIDIDSKTYDLISFTNDFIHWSTGDSRIDPEYATQQRVYNDVGKPIVDNALKGYNCCVFAYGQTGSGKTYSMIGEDNEEHQGLTPRICKALMDQAATTVPVGASPSSASSVAESVAKTTFHFEVSYIELYLEKVNDLLSAHNTHNNSNSNSVPRGGPHASSHSQSSNNLKVRENPKTGPYVEGVTVFSVSTYEELFALLEAGNKHRHVAGTGMNATSSRSHAIFTLKMTQTKPVSKDTLSADAVALISAASFGGAGGNSNGSVSSNNNTNIITCKVNLVDLAGSENVKMAQTSGARLKEGASINKSLLTLGRVIKALSEMNDNGAGGSGDGGSASTASKLTRRASMGGSSSSSSASANKTAARNSNRRRSSGCSFGPLDSSGGEEDDGEKKAPAAMVIPYRESVLTFLLKQSLGGNSKSSLIATIRPGQRYLEETLSTLRFAAQAGKVVNKPVINETNPYLKTIASVSTVASLLS